MSNRQSIDWWNGHQQAQHAAYEEMLHRKLVELCELITDHDYLWDLGDGYGGYVRDRIDEAFADYNLPVKPALQGVRSRQRIGTSKVVELMRQSGGTCAHCGSEGKLHVDHILPLSRGGSNELENLQMLCAPCNQSKHTKTMDEWVGEAS